MQSIRFADKVGVAPSTTTMFISGTRPFGECLPLPSIPERDAYVFRPRPYRRRPWESAMQGFGYVSNVGRRRRRPWGQTGLGVVNPTDAWRTGRDYGLPGTTTVQIDGGAGLGVVNPTDAWRTGRDYGLPGTATVRYWKTRDGRYRSELEGSGLGIATREANRSLSGLGTIPNDDELAKDLCYTPVHSGWIFGNKPGGGRYYVDGFYGAEAVADPEALQEMLKIQRRQTLFAGITTVAIASMAAATIITAWGSRKRKRAR